MVPESHALRAGLNFTLSIHTGALDLLGEVPGIVSFDGLWERSELMRVHGQLVRVTSLDNLIAMKRAAGRDKDRKHLAEIEHMQRASQDLDQSDTL